MPAGENYSSETAGETPVQQTLFESAAPAYKIAGVTPAASSGGAVPVEKLVQNVDNLPIPHHKILGEAMKTYIIVEVDNCLLLIDKHAAHERMNFDRLRQSAQPVPAQQLLAPMTLHLTAEDADLLEAFGELFADFGFELEPFGENTIILRAVPSGIFPEDAVPAVEEILQLLREGGKPDPASARDALLHTVACKAAIKAGWDTSPAELERITAEVLSERVKYCPHGRPVSVTVTRRELDKLFLRIV
jgi:DNA mismatch repair protein MutL